VLESDQVQRVIKVAFNDFWSLHHSSYECNERRKMKTINSVIIIFHCDCQFFKDVCADTLNVSMNLLHSANKAVTLH
jgi:hypothetical protein